MKAILRKRENIAEGTLACWFEPEEPFSFTAGQFGDFTLLNPPHSDEKGNRRAFSFASAPGHDTILVATRLSGSAFKHSLAELPIGEAVELMGPMGNFTLHKDASRPAVFLTGGIGITPVRSIVEHATSQRVSHELFVFYANRNRASTAFFEDFMAWAAENPLLHFIPSLDEPPDDWPHERGLIDEAMLQRHIAEIERPIYYVVGPPPMVAAMQSLLARMGIDELSIRSEDFYGY